MVCLWRAGRGRTSSSLSIDTLTYVSVQAVVAAAKEAEEADVAEDLELLADFGADVEVLGVELRELVLIGVYIVQRKLPPIQ